MDQIVPESALIRAGFEFREETFPHGSQAYRVLQIENREVRFVQVAEGKYIFDGERPVEEEAK